MLFSLHKISLRRLAWWQTWPTRNPRTFTMPSFSLICSLIIRSSFQLMSQIKKKAWKISSSSSKWSRNQSIGSPPVSSQTTRTSLTPCTSPNLGKLGTTAASAYTWSPRLKKNLGENFSRPVCRSSSLATNSWRCSCPMLCTTHYVSTRPTRTSRRRWARSLTKS